MKKDNHRKQFLIAIGIATLICYPFVLPQILKSNTFIVEAFHDNNKETEDSVTKETASVSSNPVSESSPAQTSVSNTAAKNASTTTVAAESSSAAESLATTAATTAAAPAKANFVTVTDDYFSDALFIGDSRTDGIRMFSGLNNTTYFCSAGLDFKDAFKKTLSIDKTTKSTLENLLATKKFGKIYIMLGINELGFPMNVIESHATQVIQTVQKYQPGAIIFVQANLHVTKSRSASDKDVNNKRINELNEILKKFANNTNIFYLDANVLFDDEHGALNPKMTSDDTHIHGKYYKTWAEWLKTKGIQK